MSICLEKASPQERQRIANLLELLPKGFQTVLEIGARDGYFSKLLLELFPAVTALDLTLPKIDQPGITPVAGDVTRLEFAADSFDVVLCSEVLEHIPAKLLPEAAGNIARVARHFVVIGVPFEQDLRLDRTTCPHCGRINPPWGHVNSFTMDGILRLFDGLELERREYVGRGKERTNALSAWLMNLAGNPWGAYGYGEQCLHCACQLTPGDAHGLGQRLLAKGAVTLNRVTQKIVKERPVWMHLVFRKPRAQ